MASAALLPRKASAVLRYFGFSNRQAFVPPAPNQATQKTETIGGDLLTLQNTMQGRRLLLAARDLYQQYLCEDLSGQFDGRLSDQHLVKMVSQPFSSAMRSVLGMRSKAKYQQQNALGKRPVLSEPFLQQVEKSWRKFFEPHERGNILIHQLKLDLLSDLASCLGEDYQADAEILLGLLREREKFAPRAVNCIDPQLVGWLQAVIKFSAGETNVPWPHSAVLFQLRLYAKGIKIASQLAEQQNHPPDSAHKINDLLRSICEIDAFSPAIVRRFVELIESGHCAISLQNLRHFCSIWRFYQLQSIQRPAPRGARDAAEKWRHVITQSFHQLGHSPPVLILPEARSALLPEFVAPNPSLRLLAGNEQLSAFINKVRLLEAHTDQTSRERRLAVDVKPLLLHGPAGTGKTVAARVVAAQLGLHFVHLDTTLIKSDYQNRSAANLREAWQHLLAWGRRSNNSLVVLVDECDSLTSERKEAESSQHNDVVNYFLQLLSERDDRIYGTGHDGGTCELYLILTTNQVNRLDNALRNRSESILVDRMLWQDALTYVLQETPAQVITDLNWQNPVMHMLGNVLAGLSLRELNTVKQKVGLPVFAVTEPQENSARFGELVFLLTERAYQLHAKHLTRWLGTFQSFLVVDNAAKYVTLALPMPSLDDLISRNLKLHPFLLPFHLSERDLFFLVNHQGFRLGLVRGRDFVLDRFAIALSSTDGLGQSAWAETITNSCWSSLQEISAGPIAGWRDYEAYWLTGKTNPSFVPWHALITEDEDNLSLAERSLGATALMLAKNGVTAGETSLLRIQLLKFRNSPG